tara:strand:+ start:1497 stop:1778 length:282 start_codon:yes stop_codon:yes gene_type:complete
MIQEAGFVTFLRTIGIILLVIYGMKFIAKYILPLILKRAITKAQERAQQQNDTDEQPSSNAIVGETIIDKKPSQSESSKTNNVGDYVDYEEVD